MEQNNNNTSEYLLVEPTPTCFQKYFSCFMRKNPNDIFMNNKNSEVNGDDDDDTPPTWIIHPGALATAKKDNSLEGRTVRFHSDCH